MAFGQPRAAGAAVLGLIKAIFKFLRHSVIFSFWSARILYLQV